MDESDWPDIGEDDFICEFGPTGGCMMDLSEHLKDCKMDECSINVLSVEVDCEMTEQEAKDHKFYILHKQAMDSFKEIVEAIELRQ